MTYTVVIPALKRMDHCKPVIEFVRGCSKESGGNAEINVVLVPLVKSIQANLKVFADDMVEKKFLEGQNETCTVWKEAIEDSGKSWHEAWMDWISSVEYLSKGTRQSQIYVALSAELPNGIVLASATSALSVPNLKLIEMPVGYDLTIRDDEFDPSSPLMEQVIHYPTWGNVEIQRGILEIANRKEAGETLAAIRNIADRQGGLELTVERRVSVAEIRGELTKLNKSRGQAIVIGDSALSERFKTLKSANLIERIPKSNDYVLTPEGVSISGLFRNVWGLHMIMSETD
jgi:hypothetical protein